MATLQLNYERSPINDCARGIEKLELNKDYPPRLPVDIYDHIDVTGILSLQQSSSVYVGYYKNEASNEYYEEEGGQRLEIVLKIGDINRIRKEAKNYETMKDLQGHSIPRTFAFYEARINKKRWMTSSDMYGCLVMERFGDSVKFVFYLLEWEEKSIILSHLQNIHNCGLVHADIAPENVLQRGNDFRLIDFGDMIEKHPCKLVNRHNKPFDFRNASHHFDYSVYSVICRHVSVVADDMNFWDEGFQIVHGLELPKEGLPSNKMMHALFPVFFIARYNEDDAKVLIEAYFRKIYDLMQRENLKDDGEAVAIIRTHTKQFAEEVESEFSHRL